MRATFSNKLVFAEPGNEKAIKYVHHFRVNVDVYIKHKKMEQRNWDVCLSAGNARNIPDEIRQGLIREFMLYIKNRVKRGVHTLDYTDFIDLAKAVNLS
jgi:hypothetical protein